MKKIIVRFMAMMAIISAMAQVPEKISYQAVIRNSSNELVVNQNVGIKISILQGSASGTVVYTEFFTTPSNENGLVSIAIGGGIGFDAIDWASGPYFIKTETDPIGGTAYTISAVSQLLSVPYALYAGQSENTRILGNEAVFNSWDKDHLDDVTLSDAQTITGSKTFTSMIHAMGLALPYTFGPDTAYVGSEGAFIGFGHEGHSEDFIGYKNNRFYFKDSPEGGDTRDPDVVVGGNIGIGIDEPWERLEVDGQVNMHDHHIINLADPVNEQDAATKAYVDASGLQSETDPVFSESLAAGIEAQDLDRWNLAHDWGNHSEAGYLSTFDEVDPTWNGIANQSGNIGRTGNVGIGTANPSQQLDVDGQIRIRGGNPGEGKILTSNATGVARWESIAEGITTESDPTWNGTANPSANIGREGNVGIGTTNPTQKLDVNGQVRIRGGSPGEGKVLTSDTDGNARWIAPAPSGGESNWIASGNNIYYNTGNVGIGTTSPAALLHTSGTGAGKGNILFAGNLSMPPGDPPAQGPGTRLMWYPDLAAFRVGRVDNNSWDKNNIGDHSVAMGYNTIASGGSSTALGHNSTASRSVSTAIGWESIASGDCATAIGSLIRATGYYSTAIGTACTSSGRNSISLGHLTTSSGESSAAIGHSSTASGKYSIALGSNTTAVSGHEIVVGSWNTLYTAAQANGWSASDRLFVIGNGTSESSRKNALTVLKNGNVGIGTSNPTYLLSVNGTIRAKKLIVETGWSDFVFEDDYQLMPLRELEEFILIHKHLPEIPSAREVEENGISVGEISASLLQKIEELTLHIIHQQKQIEELAKQNQLLKGSLSEILKK